MTRSLRVLAAMLLAASLLSFAQKLDKPQAQVLRPADNLVVDGVPDVPQAIADQVGRYSEFRGAVPTSWHTFAARARPTALQRAAVLWRVMRDGSSTPPGEPRPASAFAMSAPLAAPPAAPAP